MAQRIQAPNGEVIEFPDGMDDASISAAMQKEFGGPQAPQQQPSPPAPQAATDGGFLDAARGAYTGLHRIPQSIFEMGARATDALGISNGAYDMAHKVFTKDNASYMGDSQAAKAGDIAGQIAGTLPVAAARIPQLATMGPAIRALGGIGQAAGQGAAASALTSSASDAPILQQMGVGAALGGALPVVGLAAKGGKALAKRAIGEATGAGATSLSNAYAAGKAGGDAAQAFKDSLRGTVKWDQVVTDAKAALGNLRKQRADAYKTGMVDISKDATVLDFTPIDDALSSSIKTFKGRDISTKTADVRKEIGDVVAEWRALDPTEYHTPDGFDALKQQIGEIKDSLPFGSPSRTYAEGVYNSIRSTIAKQAPTYDKVMKGYSEASEEIAAIERELSLGKKPNPNTALRKLQSVMRDNANTSWGKRADYAQRLSEAGAPNLLPSLAGQALSTAVPRGLARMTVNPTVAGVAAYLNPLTLAGLPLASPRLMGEAAYGIGTAARGAGMIGSSFPGISALPRLAIPPAALLSQPILGGAQ